MEGLTIGLVTFIIIGLFHPIVIMTEYYVGKKTWPVFLLIGLFLIHKSLFIDDVVLSSIASITGFTSLWSIRELSQQEERVKKGWFPKNPNKR
jgi:hypothetical protein